MNFIERRKGNRQTKTVAFAAIATVFFLVKVIGARYPFLDELAHYAIVAFLGARIFLSSV